MASQDLTRHRSRADQNKAIRQQALREKLAASGLIQQVIADTKKIGQLNKELDQHSVQRLKIASELRLKLIAKYLPDLKAVEHTGVINHNVSEVSDAELLSVLEAKRILSADVEDAEIVARSPAIPADYAVLEHQPTDTIPAEPLSDAPQRATVHDNTETNTKVAGKPRKQRTRAYRAPKVEI